MTNQQQPQDGPSMGDVSAAFAAAYGAAIGKLIFEKMEIEKLVQALQARLINEETLINELEQENLRLIETKIANENRIHELEARVAQLIKDGPTTEQIAAQGKTAIDMARIKEAAPE